MSAVVWPANAPPPMQWHPAYTAPTLIGDLLRWLTQEPGTTVMTYRVPRPLVRRFIRVPPGEPYPDEVWFTLTRIRCTGRAPYVGEPFVYQWWAAMDDHGRMVAGPDQLVYVG